MPATMKTEVVGVKETIKALREIDPQFRKDFNKGARAVVARPITVPTTRRAHSPCHRPPEHTMASLTMGGAAASYRW